MLGPQNLHDFELRANIELQQVSSYTYNTNYENCTQILLSFYISLSCVTSREELRIGTGGEERILASHECDCETVNLKFGF